MPGLDARPERPDANSGNRDSWIDRLRDALASRPSQAREVAEEGLRFCPADPELLLLASLAALAMDLPERALSLLKRYGKRYVPGKPVTLLMSLALAQQGRFTHAWTMLHAAGLDNDRAALAWFVGDAVMADWLFARLREIRIERLRRSGHAPAVARRGKPRIVDPSPPLPGGESTNGRQTLTVAAATQAVVADLPRLEARLDIAFELANPDAIDIAGTEADPMAFRLCGELVRLSLSEGFDELLCLPALQGVEAHWYQVETVRKVLKQYRGRVLLADEVGLGKTIEAGMVLKEYMLRGMAERVLILTPASLVGQWRDEMASKFGTEFATSHDPLLRSDPAAFWAQPRVIASIASARRREQEA